MSVSQNYRVFHLTGVLTSATAEKLLQEFQTCLEQKITQIAINLQEVPFIDSSGLGALVAIHTKLKLANGKLYLCTLNEQAKMLLDVANMDGVFEILENENAFYRMMKS